MPKPNSAALDATLLALADPARRRVVELLKVRPHRAGEIAAALALGGPATSKHLKVLRSCALVQEERPADDARVRVYRLRPERLSELKDWLEDVETFWSDQLAAFKGAAEAAARKSAAERAVQPRSRR
jgi:DNA-binding transcriptional ArsR family regulator